MRTGRGANGKNTNRGKRGKGIRRKRVINLAEL